MHAVEDIEDIVRALDAVMVLGTKDVAGYAQQALEIDAIAVYLATQIATLESEVDREQAMADVTTHLRVAVEARLSGAAAGQALLSTGAAN